ncbi:MAG: T9SS type A sorting domain-containing protein, partial [Syntrophothermus sp.]
IGYFFTSGMNPQHIYKTQMGGAKWAELKSFTKYVQAMKFYNPELGLVINSTEIYRTKDAGYTWETFILPGKTGWGNDIEFIPGDPAKVWLTNGTALFFSGDTGKTFREISVPALNSQYRMRDIAFPDKNHGWLFADAVLYKITNPQNVTSVSDAENLRINDFSITGNYPNPFNPSTIINYQLSGESKITLEVFDLTGQRVSILAEGIRHAGTYSTSFNGSHLASGTYICRLRAVEISTGKLFTSSLKLSLIK